MPDIETNNESATRVLTTRITESDLQLVDLAAAVVNKPRAHIALEATLSAARKILDEHNIVWPPEAA